MQKQLWLGVFLLILPVTSVQVGDHCQCVSLNPWPFVEFCLVLKSNAYKLLNNGQSLAASGVPAPDLWLFGRRDKQVLCHHQLESSSWFHSPQALPYIWFVLITVGLCQQSATRYCCLPDYELAVPLHAICPRMVTVPWFQCRGPVQHSSCTGVTLSVTASPFLPMVAPTIIHLVHWSTIG